MGKKKKPLGDHIIAVNRKASFDYTLETKYEAGLVLQGWEVKSLREGRAQMTDSHVIIREGEAYIINVHISQLSTTSTHYVADPTRTRKLLLHSKEIAKLRGGIERQGYTIVPLKLYWKKNKVKIEIALAKGKQLHDKRAAEKDKEWKRTQSKLLKKG